MSWLALRNFTIFGFFSLPIIAGNIKNIVFDRAKIIVLAVIIFFFLSINHRLVIKDNLNNFGLGLMPGNNASAEFFKKQNIQGPILNNYDIGGYLIYHLFPREKVFVDNRPESYPASFFENIYIPLQDNEEKWKEENANYKFNAIFFAYHDATPWAQKFLINRASDPEWKLAFADNYAIIFLKK
jgi:hypothetical protein